MFKSVKQWSQCLLISETEGGGLQKTVEKPGSFMLKLKKWIKCYYSDI